jgi:hypothetical protein
MKKVKFLLLVITFAVFSVASTGFAQDDTKKDENEKTYKLTPEEQAKKITDRMKDKLSLTDEQYGKILKLNTDRISYMRDLRSKDLISKSEVKQKREEFRNGMKNTLTEDQQKKMKKMFKKKHMKHKRHMR